MKQVIGNRASTYIPSEHRYVEVIQCPGCGRHLKQGGYKIVDVDFVPSKRVAVCRRLACPMA